MKIIVDLNREQLDKNHYFVGRFQLNVIYGYKLDKKILRDNQTDKEEPDINK